MNTRTKESNMLGSTQWSRFLMGAGLAMACGLTVAAAGVEDSATDADGEAAFRRLVATASMRFPDDPTMRALILREADPSWSDSFSELAALELTEGAVPLIALFDPPIPPDHVIYDEVEMRVWGEAWGEFFSASILEPGTMRRTSEVAEDLLDRRGDFAELREGALLDAAEVSRGPESLPSSWRMSARRLYDGYPVRAGLVGDGRVAVFPVERTWETQDITVDSCSLEAPHARSDEHGRRCRGCRLCSRRVAADRADRERADGDGCDDRSSAAVGVERSEGMGDARGPMEALNR
jgi:hypothetical protein